jgi:hypothetical protein
MHAQPIYQEDRHTGSVQLTIIAFTLCCGVDIVFSVVDMIGHRLLPTSLHGLMQCMASVYAPCGPIASSSLNFYYLYRPQQR